MKNIKLLLIGLAAAFALTGCGDSSKDTPEPEGDGNVVGSWHLVSWSSLQSADVYLSFSESGSFDIYQRLYIFYPNLVSLLQNGLTAEQSLDYQLSRARN